MIYRFDTCTLDTTRRELRRDGMPVALEPQVFDVLAFLIEQRDRVVSRDGLLDAVWHGRIVSDATLASRIAATRAAIGDSGVAQRLIRTLPRKGVRFVGAVREAAAPCGEPPGATPEAPETRLPAVAVLPFTNMSDDPEQGYFAEGMAEEIITALSRNRAFSVIARNTSFAYSGCTIDVRQVGRDLGKRYVLSGSVRRGHDRLRITGRLVDAASGAQLWSDRFDGDARDVFELQDRVAGSVAAAIDPALRSAEIGRLRREPPARLDAYDLLLRAHALLAEFTPGSMEEALDCLGRAIAIDPAYAPAMAAFAYGRAQCHFQGWARHDDATRSVAVQLAWDAVEHAPDDAQVLWMAAFALWNMAPGARERARTLFAHSLLLDPNSAMALTLGGWIETMCGNQAVGRDMVLRARHLNPRDKQGWLMSGVLAIAAMIDADYREAARWAERALAQNRRFAAALRVVAVARIHLGEEARARDAVRELLVVEPDLTVSGFLERIPMPLEAVARTYADALRQAGLPS